ncbi:hypothetical protein [Candidatus Poriferisocius sp.]|uniref:hypothetical protein n=1 Tax=Candidatus Poriferisocius sp. TaxID=3101276 RepID=UPI003B024B4D
MPKFLNPGLRLERDYAGPDGNLSRKIVTLNSDIVPLAAFSGADRATKAWAANDLIYLWKFPEGATIHEIAALVYDVAASGDVLDVGHEQVGAGTWADDADFFFADLSLADAETVRSIGDPASATGYGTRHAPLIVNQPNVYLTATVVNAIAAGAQFGVRFYIDYEYTGNL